TINQLLQANRIESPSLIYSGLQLKIPRKPRTSTEVNAYTTETNEQGRQEVLALGRYFTYLSPFMYSFREDGSLTEMRETTLLEAVRVNDIAPLLVLTNYTGGGFNSDLGATLLRNPNIQDTLIK